MLVKVRFESLVLSLCLSSAIAAAYAQDESPAVKSGSTDVANPSSAELKDTSGQGAGVGKSPLTNDSALVDDSQKPYNEAAVKHYNRAVELHQSGFLNQAIMEYKGAVEADKRMEEAHSNLGLIYAAQHNYAKAIEAFNKALALKPGRPTTLNGFGTVLYAKGRFEEAMEKWKLAVAADPQFASAYYNMGNALENQKRYQEALEAYVKAIKINAGMADAYYRLGSIFARDKHAAQANVLLSKAVALAPDAEFSRDAKHQLSSLESQLSLENNEEPQVQMNIVPPPASVDDQAAAKGKSSTSGVTGSKVNMFVQPAQQQ